MTSSTEVDPGETFSNNSRTTFKVDVRIFIATLTTSMLLAFGIGVGTELDPTASMAVPVDLPSPKAPVVVPPERFPHDRSVDLHEHHVNFDTPSLEDLGDGAGAVHHDIHLEDRTNLEQEEEDDEMHLPAGQHLLIDIKNVEQDFLNSEERLADAIVKAVDAGGLTLLSYHCHSLIPMGVSCVGVLLESHISLHTWPEEGVITLDLFTCGSKPLTPEIDTITQLFGPPRSPGESSQAYWSHELRGFREDSTAPPGSYFDAKSDYVNWIHSPLDYHTKENVASTVSDHFRIEVWDFLESEATPSHEDALKHNLTSGDPRWLTAEIVSPDRVMFLNGALQLVKDNQREFQESLAHPPLYTHPNPVNVAILGGGNGGILQEVLKHTSVESVTVVELDPVVLELCREHFPSLSDCSGIEGATAPNCFDDDRVTIEYAEAREYIKTRYGTEKNRSPAVEAFDVIIIDVLNYNDDPAFYEDASFWDSLYHSLSDDGIFGISIGESPSINDPKLAYGKTAPRENFFKILEGHEMTKHMFVYDEGHAGRPDPISFMTVCKSTDCKKRWLAEPDAVEFELSQRIARSTTEEDILYHYDGATQYSYQHPSKGWETTYCRREPTPFECDFRGLDLTKEIYDLDLDDDSESDFDVKYVDIDGEEVVTFHAKEDIPAGSYIMPSDLAASFDIKDASLENLRANIEVSETGKVSVISDFLNYISKHGHRSIANGRGITIVEAGGSFLIRRSDDESQVNVGRWMPADRTPVFSPVYDRHLQSMDLFLVATRDIKKGEEIIKPTDLW